MNPRSTPPPIPEAPKQKQLRVQPDDPMSPDRKPPGRQQQQQGGQQQQRGGNVTPSERDIDKHHRKTGEPVDDADDDMERSRR